MKRFYTKYILLIGYILVFIVIGVGFLVGNSYKIYDNCYAAAIHSPWSWKEKYGREQLEQMFDGCIDKYEGWYGFSWKNTYSLYQDADFTESDFKDYVKNFMEDENEKGYAKWSEKEYVEYISDYSVYRGERNYVFIRLNGEIVFVQFGPTNVEDDYEGVLPKVIFYCAVLLLLPLVGFVVWKVVDMKRLSKNKLVSKEKDLVLKEKTNE